MTGVAVIGTGVISESHIEAYLAFQDRCHIAALCDLVPQKAEALKEKYHLKDTAVYSGCKEMAERSDIRLYPWGERCDLHESGKTRPGGKAHGVFTGRV